MGNDIWDILVIYAVCMIFAVGLLAGYIAILLDPEDTHLLAGLILVVAVFCSMVIAVVMAMRKEIEKYQR